MYLTTNIYGMCEDDECYLAIHNFKNGKIIKNIIYSNFTQNNNAQLQIHASVVLFNTFGVVSRNQGDI